MRELPAVRTGLTAPWTRLAWMQAAYCLVSFVPALVGFALILTVVVALGSVLTLTVLGAVPGIFFLVGALPSPGAWARCSGASPGL
ncbi:hypothetical protein ACFYXC_13125 [Streptomyces sp. NPDC002701]|uniref:hypothetical protein n=1 Tax=Streptomyces sp. NPDC002701 TaxID=3364661 RepID=UPI003692B87A